MYTELDALYPYGIPKRALDEKKIIEKSVFFNWVDEHTRLVIIQKIAESIGMFNVLTTYVPAKTISGQIPGDDSGHLNYKTGKIMINPNSKYHIYGHYYNILLTLYHEKFHYDYHYKQGLLESERSRVEYQTYEHIYNHDLFYETTFDYQGMVVKEMQKNALDMGEFPAY